MYIGAIKSKTPIREFSGKILGWIETDDKGNQQVRTFTGQIVGWYDAQQNVTRTFNGAIVGHTNMATALLFMNN